MRNQWSEFLERLEAEGTEELLKFGVERSLVAEERLIAEGQRLSSLFFVLDGLLEVRRSGFGNKKLAIIGPGEMAGEMSFVSDEPASADVIAAEPSHVLEVPRVQLQELLTKSPQFSASFYKALAAIIAERLREARRAESTNESVAGWAQEIDASIQDLQRQAAEFVEQARQKNNQVPSAQRAEVAKKFVDLAMWISSVIDSRCGENEELRRLLGRHVQQVLLPYMLLSQLAERIYSKPRGYAGDFFTIEVIYRDTPTGVGALGELVDLAYLNLPGAVAVKNRRGLLHAAINETVAAVGTRPARIMSIASGPAAEVFDAYALLDRPERLRATLLDVDSEALGFVADKLSQSHLKDYIQLVQENAVYLAIGRRTLALEPQDLVYSIGLIDYFNDKTVLKLLDYIHSVLRPGGRVILGNFHPRNPVRTFMDYVLDWKLIHRSEEDMNRLFSASAFGRPCTRIQFEQQGINLFAECVKPE